MEPATQRERFEAVKERFAVHADDSLAEAPLRNWTLPADRQLPSAYMDRSLRDVLRIPFGLLETTKGVGPTRLERLLALIERAVISVERCATTATQNGRDQLSKALSDRDWSQSTTSLLEEFDLSSLSEEQWHALSSTIRQHRLEQYPLGRFAMSLKDLPRGLWHEPLESFVGHSLVEIRRSGGYGESRVSQIARIVFDLATFLSALPPGSHFSVQILPTEILVVMHWVEHVLEQDEPPGYEELHDRFVSPLVRQLEADLSPAIAHMIERRLGVLGRSETLDEIAADFGLTRERIRQLTARAPEILQVRWPEGRHLLDDFYEKFRDAPQAHRQLQLVRHALDQLFEVRTTSGASYAEVLSEWEAAGRRKQTPMSEREICCWLACVFPELAPATGLKWIKQEALAWETADRGTVYFTNEELDVLLYQLYSRAAPTDLSDLIDLEEKDERNLRGRISRDQRFIDDDYKRLLPAEHCSLVCFSGVWHVRLTEAGEMPITQKTIPIETLAHSVVSGLLQAGIADATVWGVHRYANDLLDQLFNARLPQTLTPFILGDRFVCSTNGLIRPMRRRRLCWDSPHHAVRAKGKRGWVSHVVLQHGVPITLGELGDLLRCQYQDYAPYVLEQIKLAPDDEEGEIHCSAILYPGVPHRVPGLLVPGNWELDATEDNVSEELKHLVSRFVLMMRQNLLCEDDFSGAAWLLELIRRHMYGESTRKAVPRIPARFSCEEGPDEGVSALNAAAGNGKEQQPAVARSAQDVDRLLSRFF